MNLQHFCQIVVTPVIVTIVKVGGDEYERDSDEYSTRFSSGLQRRSAEPGHVSKHELRERCTRTLARLTTRATQDKWDAFTGCQQWDTREQQETQRET